VKWALYEMGRIDRGIRLPLLELSEPHRAELRVRLKTVGALR
jgi:4-hydroxy-tetrahydrodipicolinate synthase